MGIDPKDIFDAAIIGGLKILFTGTFSPYVISILGIAVGSALIEKWLIMRRREGSAKAVKTGSFLLGGVITLTLFLKSVRHIFNLITLS